MLILEKGKNILDKNNDARTSLVKTSGYVKVTVCLLSTSGLKEKHKHRDTVLGRRASTKEITTGKSVETGSKL